MEQKGETMKTAVVYYSFEGNCAFAAQVLQKALDAALFEIKTLDTKKRKGLFKYLWGGKQVMMGVKPEIGKLAFDPASYDLIILGTPVWAGSPAPAMVSFLEAHPIGEKRTALYVCHAGGKGRALEKFRALLPGAALTGELDLVNPAAKPEPARQALEAWAKSLTG
jgi:flavodoxin